MQLKSWKLIQRCSKLFFFLINKTGASYRDEIGQIKSVLRFSSMKFLRASCLDTEREYMGPTGDWAPFSRLILRSSEWWGARTSALVLLKTSMNL